MPTRPVRTTRAMSSRQRRSKKRHLYLAQNVLLRPLPHPPPRTRTNPQTQDPPQRRRQRNPRQPPPHLPPLQPTTPHRLTRRTTTHGTPAA